LAAVLWVKLLEIDDVAIVLVVAIEPVGAADGLEQVVVVQFVIEVDVGAAGRVPAFCRRRQI
jgi:hypothetical protein